MEEAVISGIAFNRDEAKITVMGVPDRPGIAYAILDTIVIMISVNSAINGQATKNVLGGFIAWAMIICWIIYWVQLARYKNKLKRLPA